MAASSYKPGEFFCKHQLQGIVNKQTTSEEVIVDVTGKEENEERSFEDLENDIANNDQGKTSEEGAKPQQEHVNAQQHKTRAKKETEEVFMDSRESRRSLFVSWTLELSDHSFNCLLLTLRGRAPPPWKNFSCRMLVSLTLQGRVPLGRVPLPPRVTLFSCKQALKVPKAYFLRNFFYVLSCIS